MIPLHPSFDEERGFIAVILSWFLSQLAKVLRGWYRDKKFNFRWLFDTGGMPSSHSATVASLATVVGLYYGFNTLLFLIVLVFTMITMFDAAGVRRNVGRQASILNKMLTDLYEKGEVPETRLKELLGHTPVEVFAGAFLGIVIALLTCHA
ncbi:MAG: divergent PAP2 family protein [Candidatus Omnitrophica bacterium]|nr:divergent PAP2 family protein [Candidatus Omnitrophota bacterium]MDD5670188.1 divergent PAP2 family protein [Candidatus Omnitrophota bacterium]